MWPRRVWVSTLICLRLRSPVALMKEVGADEVDEFVGLLPPCVVFLFGLFFELLYGC
jgi:hypothetical protein